MEGGYVIELDKSTRYLYKDKVQTKDSKRVGCTMYEETIPCQQNLEEHKELDHELIAICVLKCF